MATDVALGGANNAALLVKTDGIFGWLVILPGFDFDKDEGVAIPGDHVDFAALRAIPGSDDAEAERSNVINCQNFRPAAEWEQATKEQRKWHR